MVLFSHLSVFTSIKSTQPWLEPETWRTVRKHYPGEHLTPNGRHYGVPCLHVPVPPEAVACSATTHDLGENIPGLGGCWGTTLSTRLYERRWPEVPGVLKIARGYLLTEAMNFHAAPSQTRRELQTLCMLNRQRELAPTAAPHCGSHCHQPRVFV